MKIFPVKRRKVRLRKKISGTKEIPRLTIYKSLYSLYAQLIDDRSQRTLASAMMKGKKNLPAARELGFKIAQVAKEKDIERVVYDRNGLRYHGIIKMIADSAREAGLKI